MKVEVNLPPLTVIKNIARYAKFLKESCTHKRRSRSQEKVMVSKNVTSLIKKNLPEKCVDLDMFLLPCTIGNRNISNAMLDLGASINVMPLSVFKDLGLNELEKTSICIQLADRSFISLLEIVEDVLVKVGNLIFPAEFYIIEMNNGYACTSPTILLGRPFLKTAKAKINVDKGLLNVEFGETQEEHDKFNELFDQATLKHVEYEFAKNKPSNDDLSIFLDFVASVNDEHVLVDNLATNGHHVLDNDFASSNEHDLGRNINNDDEHTLKGIDNENDLGTNVVEIAYEFDDNFF
ncbi:uncharacterized protein E5676_scaffold945G00040 [Cucumis melo var. makuwa]|uniref:Uncharacterized protein n=1 Tax=Cucumis melo var. makuwa TaxID=1194695 RepID=A0A5D3D5G7_CUCMM|nr:uncharacterized protein E6C27_scaffold673G00050 [Cucumis melo var. makuwa]TYK18791.1 uncharacterized protein E5676_scaffold945G00040 [Cucumis melo var. makuwa]